MRWKAQKLEALSARNEKKEAEATPDVEAWVDFLGAILSSGSANREGLLLHWYSGGLDSENIRFRGTVEKNISEVSADELMRIEEDVWYVFRK